MAAQLASGAHVMELSFMVPYAACVHACVREHVCALVCVRRELDNFELHGAVRCVCVCLCVCVCVCVCVN